MAQRSLIDNLQKEVIDLENKKEDLEDLSPETALSLNPIKGEFNTDQWVASMQAVQIDIANKRLELDIAKKTYEKYFGVTTTPEA